MPNPLDEFGSMVFHDRLMRERLPEETYRTLQETIRDGGRLGLPVADAVANAMKDWAVEKGVTHFSHWFQPMTGVTAEKHDSFLAPASDERRFDGRVIMEFSGKELIQGEPDASSFPSGGLRATFEARGYTAWDPTSSAFIKDGTLCIPSVFYSFGGEALDKKTPLLRSMESISRQAVRVLRLLGETCVRRVTTNVGAEQEYFLIDAELYAKRRDLVFCGRTLFGARPPKGQELDDHFFGAIRPRVHAFMRELNGELWRLGVSSKTEHNEVAPAQHELALIYTNSNAATDHNQLVMEMMKKVAERHNLACLLHEKPFAGVNGSGKHNNWSLSTDLGENLLEPGENPGGNLRFLLFLVAVIAAADDYQDLLRLSVASAGNDHRLGASDAPPAIMSVFLGDTLTRALEDLGACADAGAEGGGTRVSAAADTTAGATAGADATAGAKGGGSGDVRGASGGDDPTGGASVVAGDSTGGVLGDASGGETEDLFADDTVPEALHSPQERQRQPSPGPGTAAAHALSSGGMMQEINILPGVSVLPRLERDDTDRNRTSPFAFTGDKFEFRMMGSTLSISGPNIVINTIVAESLSRLADRLEACADVRAELPRLIYQTFAAHRRILFNGNNYSAEWILEARRRGLLNIESAAESLPWFVDQKNIALFTKHGIFTEHEIRSRYEILMGGYVKALNIEALTMLDIARTQILPAVSGYCDRLAQSAVHQKMLCPELECQMERAVVTRASKLADSLFHKTEALDQSLLEAKALEPGDIRACAKFYREGVFIAMQELRAVADELETLVGRADWPFPNYGDLLFSV
jgi:glutamine synthetase type III